MNFDKLIYNLVSGIFLSKLGMRLFAFGMALNFDPKFAWKKTHWIFRTCMIKNVLFSDTEDASETDVAKQETQYTEIKEQ